MLSFSAMSVVPPAADMESQHGWPVGDPKLPDIGERAVPSATALYGSGDLIESGNLVFQNYSTGHELGFLECPLGAICIETMDSSCRTFEFIISFVIVGFTCAFGFVGNFLSIVTLRRDSVKSVTTYLLTWLAIADTAFLVPVVFVIMLPTYCEFFNNCAEPVQRALLYLEQYGWAVASTMHTCTVYVTVLVALHRYICVCRPHDARRLSGYRRAKIQIALIPICALIYNLPRIFEYQVALILVNENNKTQLETQKNLTSIGKNVWYQVIYKNVCFYLIMYIIPLGTLSVLSIRLAQTLHKRRKSRCRGQYNRAHHKRDDNITLVLIIIIAVFVVCQTPTLIQRLILAVEGAKGHTCGNVYFYFEQIADYFALLNSCINFVIYVLFARHFRQTLMSHVVYVYCPISVSTISKSPPLVDTNGTTNAAVVKGTSNSSPIDLRVCSQYKDKDVDSNLLDRNDLQTSKPLLEPLTTDECRYKEVPRPMVDHDLAGKTPSARETTTCQRNDAYVADTEKDNLTADSEPSIDSFENIPTLNETFV